MKLDRIYINRDERCDDAPMLGELLIPEVRQDQKVILRKFRTIELPWLNNSRGVSAIPDGLYQVRRRDYGIFYRRYKKDFGHAWVAEICNVPGRTAILFHIGNFCGPAPHQTDSKGCVLVGYPDTRKNKGGVPMVLNSARAYKVFYSLLGELFKRSSVLEVNVRTCGSPCLMVK